MKIKVVVLPPGGKPIIVYDEDPDRLLLFTVTYNKKIKPREYTTPEEIVEVFKTLATRGHNTKSDYNPDLVYKFLEAILASDVPMREKLTQVLKYVRSAVKA